MKNIFFFQIYKAVLEFSVQKPTCVEFWVLDGMLALATAAKLLWDPGSVHWKANSSN